MTEHFDVKAFVERWLAENGYRQQYHLAVGKNTEDEEEATDNGE